VIIEKHDVPHWVMFIFINCVSLLNVKAYSASFDGIMLYNCPRLFDIVWEDLTFEKLG
jgi:hypothetical protein